MDDSLIVEEPQTESVTDSYVIYASRNLNGLSSIYSYETFQTELTDYSNADFTTDGKLLTFAPDETNTFYGYETLTANVDNDGLSYLIWNNPMQVDAIDTTVSPTLSFDQIDTIARNYIDSRSVSSPYPDTQTVTESASAESEFPTVTQIRYGMIRISDPEHSTYLLPPHGITSQSNSKNYITMRTSTLSSMPSTAASTTRGLAHWNQPTTTRQINKNHKKRDCICNPFCSVCDFKFIY